MFRAVGILLQGIFMTGVVVVILAATELFNRKR